MSDKTYQKFIKPLMDSVTALMIILIMMPLFLIIILFLVLFNKGQVFFIQQRPGKYAKLFYLIKFKTMNDARDESGDLLPDKLRLTRIGRILRRTSLDELPQLINILKGEMSFVGPRPLLKDYLPLYNATQQKRHNVKPGITGWAQVNGRNALSWERKFSLDVWYVNNLNFTVDLKILLLTLRKVLQLADIDHPGSVSIQKFTG